MDQAALGERWAMARLDDVITVLRSMEQWLNSATKGSVVLDFAGGHIVVKTTRIDDLEVAKPAPAPDHIGPMTPEPPQ